MPSYDWANGGSIDIFWDGECDFSTVGFGVILGNGCGIQGQNYVALLPGTKATAGFHYSSWVVCILGYRFYLTTSVTMM